MIADLEPRDKTLSKFRKLPFIDRRSNILHQLQKKTQIVNAVERVPEELFASDQMT